MQSSEPEDITRLLLAWSQGDSAAFEQLSAEVYKRLSNLAASYLRGERPDHTLETAALVNEAFLRLVDQHSVRWRDRSHFFAIAAKLMRRILVDHARRHAASKRGGGAQKILFEDLAQLSPRQHPDLLALDDALQDLERRDGELAEVVVLRYFGGLTKEEVAEVMGRSTATIARRWRTARAWLYAYLVEGEVDEF